MDFGIIARGAWHKLTQRNPTSLVPHLLANNDPPSQKDLGLIQETISMARAKVMDLQSKYSGETPSRSLSNQVEALQDFIRIHKSLLSVLRHVPPEIWGLVFEHALPNVYVTGCHDISLTIKFARVCRLWRNIALSTPQLWGVLPPFRLDRKGTRNPSYLHRLRTILERGQEAPILFHVNEPREDTPPHPVWSLLATQSSRWKQVTMIAKGTTLEDLKISTKLPLLHTLKLEINNMKILPKIITVFRDAPSLRVVRIEALWPVKIELPWHQLEVYSESNAAQTVGFPHVLHHSINLRRLSYFTYFLGVTSADFTHMTFSRLTSLRLHFYREGMDFGPLLDNITLPALENLQISNRAGTLIDQLLALVRRSMCTLKRLAFSTVPFQIQTGKLTELLLLTPFLQELEVNDIPDEDLKHLTQPSLVPCLRSLVVHFNPSWARRPSSINPQGFNTLARSRCDQSLFRKEGGSYVRLEELRLVFPKQQECLSCHTVLEGWDQVPRSQTDWQVLSKCKEELEAMFPSNYQPTRPAKKKDMIDPSQLQALFRTLNGLQSVDSRIMLQSGVINHVLGFVSPFLYSRLSKAYHKLAQETIATLRQKWCARAEQDSLMLHWIRRGQACLVYYPNQTLGAREFILGMPEPLPLVELFWPIFEYYTPLN